MTAELSEERTANVAQLIRAVDRLLDHVTHWTPSRWAVSGASDGASRADAAHALAQRLADLAAEATGQPSRPVPRLDNPLALCDQIRVTAQDLVRADPDQQVIIVALDAVGHTDRAL
jgi:hypothetical protein